MKYFSVLVESIAHDQAANLGLEYYGFGRYGKAGIVTHTSHTGRLIPVAKTFSSTKGEPVLLHFTHLEDQMIERGVEGARQALDTLHNVVNDPKLMHVQTKIEGAPSLFFGKHPKTGKFFVATKSLYNANPKINYTHEDIEKNHGHAPGLTSKLHVALDELPKIYKGNHVMQGDVMFTPGDVDTRDIGGEKHYTFKPNVIRNAVPVNSELGHQIKRAKFGIAIHTKYNDNEERLPADSSEVNKHNDVFLMPVSAHVENMKHHKEAISDIGKTLQAIPKQSFDEVSKPEHKALVMQYMNHSVKTQQPVSTENFINFADQYHQKAIDKLKTESSKQKKTAVKETYLKSLRANRHHFDKVFNVHQKVASLKDKIIDDLDNHQSIKRYFDTNTGIDQTGPEGYVAIGSHGTHKLVKRSGFSLQNFTQTKDWGTKDEPQKTDRAVVTLGRMSPPHVEHSNLVNAVVQHANAQGADPFVYVTHTQDNKKNPLSASEKLELLRAAHPEHAHIFHATSKDAPSLTHVLAHLHEKGYKKVDVVLGDDRTQDFGYLHKYNGKFTPEGKGYKFDEMNIISRHDIHSTKDASGDGVHASDLRTAAQNDDFATFRAGMHPNIPDKMVRQTMKKIKNKLNESVLSFISYLIEAKLK